MSLELFTPGADRGIDIRYLATRGDAPFIAQCKRWDHSAYTKLVDHLERDELPKLNALAPEKYILITSVGLTPGRKEEIRKRLHPWIRSDADIYGRDDVSGLLARHSDVEHRHIKLWLTSTEVLTAILHSDILNRTADTVARLRRQLQLWVPNPSYEAARANLSEHHVCLIAGKPGIGKSMLAEIILSEHCADGYEPVIISSDVSEAEGMWRDTAKQVFYYDDFLGQVSYGELHLSKNEDKRLARFIDRVRQANDKRLIITTREYILREAALHYDTLAQIDQAPYKTIVALDDYTKFIRAQILYNHLFFSQLRQDIKVAVLKDKAYMKIIRHRNYNPRIIEHMTDVMGASIEAPEVFVSSFLQLLDNPTRVWEVAFTNLSLLSRKILLVLASLPPEVFLEDLRDAVRPGSYLETDSADFRNSLNVLEATFIRIERPVNAISKESIVSVRDPSVVDFLRARLRSEDGGAEEVLRTAVAFEQLIFLWYDVEYQAPTNSQTRGKCLHLLRADALAKRALELMTAKPAAIHNFRFPNAVFAWARNSEDIASRVTFVAEVLRDCDASERPLVQASLQRGIATVSSQWDKGRGSTDSGLQLLSTVDESQFPDDMRLSLERSLLSRLCMSLDTVERFEELAGLRDQKPYLFSEGLTPWKDEFERFAASEADYLSTQIDDIGWIEESMDRLGLLAERFDADVAYEQEELSVRVDELRLKQRDDDDDDHDWRGGSGVTSLGRDDDEQIDALMGSLAFTD